jgi:predicted porin
VIGEWTKTTIDDSSYSDRTQYYVTGAYRFGAWTPNLTWGRRDNEAKPGIIALLPNVPPLAGLRAATSGVVQSEALDATYWSYGLRWDVATNVALKADYTQYTNDTPASADADSLAVGVVFTF